MSGFPLRAFSDRMINRDEKSYGQRLQQFFSESQNYLPAVLVTGSSRGLGKIIAERFAADRHPVVLQGRNHEALQKIHDSIRGEGWVAGDLRDPFVIDQLADLAQAVKLRILINNAAAYFHGDLGTTPIRDIIETDLIAPMLLTQRLYPILKENRGMIININSTAGKQPGHLETAYSAAKHGLRGFSRSLRLEARRDGIRICDVYVGAMRTTMLAHRTDLGEAIDPYEVAGVIVEAARSRASLQVDEIDLSRLKMAPQ